MFVTLLKNRYAVFIKMLAFISSRMLIAMS